MQSNSDSPNVRLSGTAKSHVLKLPRRLWITTGSLLGGLLVGLALLLQGGNPPLAQAQSYTNSGSITINDSTGSGPAPATPYSSNITISNVVGKITNLQVTLNGFTHGTPSDVDVLLVGPGGQSTLLMANSGASNAVSNLNLTFDDRASASLPQSALSSGTFKPTQNGNFSPAFSLPAPAAPYGRTLGGSFSGKDPNGTWKLYIIDENAGGFGSVSGGWTLNIISADISMSNTGTPSPVNAGSNITYNITATNAGPDPAQSAIFTDTIPTNTTFVSSAAPAGWTCTTPTVGSSGVLNCSSNSDFAIGSAAFQLVVKVTPTVASGTTITNTATIASGTPDTVISNNAATFVDTVSTSADLQVGTTASPSPVTAGTDITYSSTITNAGPSNALSTIFTDTLPANTTFKALTIPTNSGWTCSTPAVGSSGNIVCNNSSLGLVSTTFVITANVNSNVLVNSSLVNGVAASSTTPDATTSNNTNSVTTPVTTLADLGVTKTGIPSAVNSGNNVSYTITVTNAGPSYAAAAVLNDPLPTNTTFQSLGSLPTGWSCTQPTVGNNGTLNCTNSAFALTTATFNLNVNVNPNTPLNTTITNTATVSASTTDNSNTNNTASAKTTVGTIADLAVVTTGTPTTVNPGTALTYTLAVTNNGPSFATNVVLSDPLPPSTTFKSLGTLPAGWTCNTLTVGSPGTLTCRNASLDLITSNITVTVNVDPALANGSTIQNTASVSADTGDNTPANNQSTSSTAVAAVADLSITSETNTPNPVLAGSMLTYSIVISNAGPSNAANATLSDTLPVSTTFQSITPAAGWTCTNPTIGSGGSVSCTNSSFGLTTASFTLVVKIDPAVITGTVISNPISLSSGTTDPTSGNNTATTSVTVQTQADLQISQVGQPNPVSPNDTINYAITLVNAGPSNSLSVTLTDTVPSNTLFQSFTAPSGWTCSTPSVNGIGTVSCTISSLNVGTTSFTLQVKVKGGVATGTVINNGAGVSSASTPDNVSSNDFRNSAIGVNCDTTVVTNGLDNGTCGTLRVAVDSAVPGTPITGKLIVPTRLTMAVGASPISLPPNVTLNLPYDTTNGPLFTLDGNNQPIDGLILSQNDTVIGLRIVGFGGRQLVAPTGGNNHLQHVVIRRS